MYKDALEDKRFIFNFPDLFRSTPPLRRDVFEKKCLVEKDH